jgi:hypothetical protein
MEQTLMCANDVVRERTITLATLVMGCSTWVRGNNSNDALRRLSTSYAGYTGFAREAA